MGRRSPSVSTSSAENIASHLPFSALILGVSTLDSQVASRRALSSESAGAESQYYTDTEIVTVPATADGATEIPVASTSATPAPTINTEKRR